MLLSIPTPLCTVPHHETDAARLPFDPAIQALFHHPAMGFVVMDIAKRYVLVNPVAARFFGEPAEKLVGQSHRDLFPDACYQEVFEELEDGRWVCLSQYRPSCVPIQSTDYWDISIARYLNQSGEACGYLLLIQEVSSFRHAVQDAARQRKLFSALLERVPTGVIIAQGELGRITVANAAARELCGECVKEGTLLSHCSTCQETTSDNSHPMRDVALPLMAAIRGGNNQLGINVQMTRSDGKSMTMQMDCAPIGLFDGEPAAIAIFQDVTGYAEQERRLAQENRYLQELDHEKDTFLANISHELKTPLTAILGWAKAALEMDDHQLSAQALEVIARNAQRQAWMVDDLLTLSNCLAGRLSLRPELVEVAAICEESVARARCAMHDCQIDVRVHVSPELTCIADPIRLRQLLDNLLTNAMKFTPSDGAVIVDAQETETEVRITVSDTGIGLDHRQMESVFRPFWQADASPSRRFNGSGIGLTVVKELVTLHGGKVAVESSGPNQGTRFTVFLPKDADV